MSDLLAIKAKFSPATQLVFDLLISGEDIVDDDAIQTWKKNVEILGRKEINDMVYHSYDPRHWEDLGADSSRMPLQDDTIYYGDYGSRGQLRAISSEARELVRRLRDLFVKQTNNPDWAYKNTKDHREISQHELYVMLEDGDFDDILGGKFDHRDVDEIFKALLPDQSPCQ